MDPDAGTDREPPRFAGRTRLPWLGIITGTVLVSLLHAAGRVDYLLFHSLVEAFAVVIACGIFMIGWNARAIMANNYLLFIGIAYLFVAALDLMHLLGYRGMGVFAEEHAADRAAQLWVAARGLEAVALLLAPLWHRRRLAPSPLILLCALATATAMGLIFHGRFPTCYVDGQGLTPFKQAAEAVICLVLGGALLLLARQRKSFDPGLYRLAAASILVTIASEVAFALYQDPYGVLNQVGHLLKLVSFYLMYEAVIANGLRKPYGVLFRELSQSEEQLRQANRELDGYAHTVSHDLKNPLAAVIGAGSTIEKLLEQEPVNVDDLRKMSGIIVRSGRTTVELINDVLMLAEAGQRPRAVEWVQVNDVVRRILEERAATIRERGVQVRVEPTLGQVRAAPAHIYQIFSNLVANSLRHNQSGHPVIEIQRKLPRGHQQAAHLFRVHDNGAGIPPADLPHVFNAFYKGRTGGHGIGLSTVSKIVKLYGGEISAYNQNGACFEFSLHDWVDG